MPSQSQAQGQCADLSLQRLNQSDPRPRLGLIRQPFGPLQGGTGAKRAPGIYTGTRILNTKGTDKIGPRNPALKNQCARLIGKPSAPAHRRERARSRHQTAQTGPVGHILPTEVIVVSFALDGRPSQTNHPSLGRVQCNREVARYCRRTCGHVTLLLPGRVTSANQSGVASLPKDISPAPQRDKNIYRFRRINPQALSRLKPKARNGRRAGRGHSGNRRFQGGAPGLSPQSPCDGP